MPTFRKGSFELTAAQSHIYILLLLSPRSKNCMMLTRSRIHIKRYSNSVFRSPFFYCGDSGACLCQEDLDSRSVYFRSSLTFFHWRRRLCVRNILFFAARFFSGGFWSLLVAGTVPACLRPYCAVHRRIPVNPELKTPTSSSGAHIYI